jgi:hypothetical protein
VKRHRLEVADVFRQHEQEFLKQRGHMLSSEQLRAFRDICACRTAALGSHIEQCDACSHQFIAYDSCRNRHCPKCQSSMRDKWLQARANELLPVPYSHVVFTLPQELTWLALRNRRVIFNILFQAVSETLLTIAADPRHLGASIGFLAVLHTWNQKLLFHPHLHCMIPAGGFSPDHSRWIRCREKYLLPVAVLRKMFRGKFLSLLAAAYRAKQLKFSGKCARLAETTAFDRLLRLLKTKKWVVYAKRPFRDPVHIIKYLARYTHRVAISNGRLIEMRDRQITFRWRDSADGNRQKPMTLDTIDFIRRFLLHILPKGFVKIRHFGFMANRHRRQSVALCRSLLEVVTKPIQTVLTEQERHAVERKCPLCRNGRLHIVGRMPAGQFLSIDSSPVCADTS